jgi:hypothetical protein
MWKRLVAKRNRNRALYGALILSVIFLGLGSRKFGFWLPGALRKSTGDVLWATMVFLLGGLLLPRSSTLTIARGAMVFSVCIEFAKLYRAPWLETIRATVPGRLVFGYVFSWNNLFYYLVGVLLGVGLEMALPRSRDESAERST